MNIKSLQKEIHKENVDAGWWDDKKPNEATRIASAIAMMHITLSKALETVRKGGTVDFVSVYQDLDLCLNRDDSDTMLIKLALMHSELSEAAEYHISGGNDDHLTNRKGEEAELSDAVIRILDYAEKKGYNLQDTMKEKREYNKSRKDHTPEERKKKNGKQF